MFQTSSQHATSSIFSPSVVTASTVSTVQGNQPSPEKEHRHRLILSAFHPDTPIDLAPLFEASDTSSLKDLKRWIKKSVSLDYHEDKWSTPEFQAIFKHLERASEVQVMLNRLFPTLDAMIRLESIIVKSAELPHTICSAIESVQDQIAETKRSDSDRTTNLTNYLGSILSHGAASIHKRIQSPESNVKYWPSLAVIFLFMNYRLGGLLVDITRFADQITCMAAVKIFFKNVDVRVWISEDLSCYSRIAVEIIAEKSLTHNNMPALLGFEINSPVQLETIKNLGNLTIDLFYNQSVVDFKIEGTLPFFANLKEYSIKCRLQ
jgi:hypothetical protein